MEKKVPKKVKWDEGLPYSQRGMPRSRDDKGSVPIRRMGRVVSASPGDAHVAVARASAEYVTEPASVFPKKA